MRSGVIYIIPQELRTAKAVANGIAAAIRGGDTP